MVFNGNQVSVLQDQKVLEVAGVGWGGGGCTITGTHRTPLSCTLRSGRDSDGRSLLTCILLQFKGEC